MPGQSSNCHKAGTIIRAIETAVAWRIVANHVSALTEGDLRPKGYIGDFGVLRRNMSAADGVRNSARHWQSDG